MRKPWAWPAAIALVAFGLVGVGLVLARTLNLAACPLCILQRMLYLLLGLTALLACALHARRAAQYAIQRWLAGAMGAIALTGAGIAGYQSWLQRFATDSSCALDQPWWERLVNWAGTQWPLLFEASGFCSEAGWRLFGLSIAEWSLLAFLALAGVALVMLKQRR
jgi:disulfide bond formation protein DsbB